jgi:hypothetical protein
MTQKELNELWKKYKDHDDSYDLFEAEIEKAGGLRVGEFDYSPDSDVGGTYGLEELWEVLEKRGFTILKNPTRHGLCDNGVVIFPPTKE